MVWIIRHPRFCGKFTDDKEIAEHWENKGGQGCTAPLFLHSQPAPDVKALVEALECISKKSHDALKMTDNRAGRAKDEIMCGYAEHIIQMCDAALAAYLKQDHINTEPLIRLIDYEALQAECEKLESWQLNALKPWPHTASKEVSDGRHSDSMHLRNKG